MSELYYVCHYDGFDNSWMDCIGPVSRDEATAYWRKKTKGGTEQVAYDHIDYYAVVSQSNHARGRYHNEARVERTVTFRESTQ